MELFPTVTAHHISPWTPSFFKGTRRWQNPFGCVFCTDKYISKLCRIIHLPMMICSFSGPSLLPFKLSHCVICNVYSPHAGFIYRSYEGTALLAHSLKAAAVTYCKWGWSCYNMLNIKQTLSIIRMIFCNSILLTVEVRFEPNSAKIKAQHVATHFKRERERNREGESLCTNEALDIPH